MHQFSESDLRQFSDRGIPVEKIRDQIHHFESGFPKLNLQRTAFIGDGIKRLTESEIQAYRERYEHWLSGPHRVYKFVPASGAASRMFKHLFAFQENYGLQRDQKLLEDQSFGSAHTFFNRLKDFAFYQDLEKVMGLQGLNLDHLVADGNFVPILEYLLDPAGLNYGSLPKGLLKFHRYDGKARTPVEEHMVEGALYCATGGDVFIHFTVSGEHKVFFQQLLKDLQPHYEKTYNVRFDISFSEQKSSTDTIAVDLDNHPFRDRDDGILFRPGGHGALLENLNHLDADLIFVKNIDNVVPDHMKEITYLHKKVIGGVLLDFQQRIFAYLKSMEDANQVKDDLLREVTNFIQTELCTELHDSFHTSSRHAQVSFLKAKLDRPIRVCGIVVNTGEPGGGPFWAENSDGTVSLQVAEPPQIDMDDPNQLQVFQNSTHFNPTDLVCGVRNYQGAAFDLTQYRDPQTGFIAQKSKDGRDLKAQELPGLWNGSMSDWNTIFVEVPVATFNPVKTVNDLLRKEHQS